MCAGKGYAPLRVNDRTPRGTMIIVDTSTPVASIVLPASVFSSILGNY